MKPKKLRLPLLSSGVLEQLVVGGWSYFEQKLDGFLVDELREVIMSHDFFDIPKRLDDLIIGLSQNDGVIDTSQHTVIELPESEFAVLSVELELPEFDLSVFNVPFVLFDFLLSPQNDFADSRLQIGSFALYLCDFHVVLKGALVVFDPVSPLQLHASLSQLNVVFLIDQFLN